MLKRVARFITQNSGSEISTYFQLELRTQVHANLAYLAGFSKTVALLEVVYESRKHTTSVVLAEKKRSRGAVRSYTTAGLFEEKRESAHVALSKQQRRGFLLHVVREIEILSALLYGIF